jgi:phosphoglycolate phosphatase
MSDKYEAVLFDLDGTLLNTIADLTASMNEVLEQRGCPVHSEDDYRYFVGDGVHMLAARALPGPLPSEAAVQEAVQAFRQVYSRRWRETTRPYPGIEDLLQALMHKGVPMGVVSNKPHEPTLACIQAFFPHVPFAVVAGQTEDLPPKPDPAGLHAALKACGAAPERSLYLGDSNIDMQAARRAGMKAVGAAWGFRTREELEEHEAFYVAAHPLDVVKLMG